MLGWVRTILPSRFQFKFEKEAPIVVQETSIRSVPTLTGDGINTHNTKQRLPAEIFTDIIMILKMFEIEVS